MRIPILVITFQYPEVYGKIYSSGKKYGIKYITDLHAFQGGATNSSYNRVDPNDPVFWEHEKNDHPYFFWTQFCILDVENLSLYK